MSAWQVVRCPACTAILFEVLGLNEHSLIRKICKCRRVILIGKQWQTEVSQEQQPVKR